MSEHKKVFISYSWAVQEKVVELAERLIASGIDVVLDVYDLKEGQDKYAFMEQSVNDVSICRVLIICDKTYTKKANNREGGVGDETVIISPEIYGRMEQEKFLPVIFEVDESGKPYCPHYIKSRIYIDLSTEDDRYEAEYEKLLRNIYEKPLYKKPALGSKPEWLENETVDLSQLRDIVKQIKGYTGNNTAKADFLLRNGVEQFVQVAKQYGSDNISSLISVIDSTKPYRDIFADFCEALIYSSLNISGTISTLIEKLYNDLHDATDTHDYSNDEFELYDYLIWELLITCTAVLLYYEKYQALHDILCHTYFLRKSCFEGTVESHSYFKFRPKFRTIERHCKLNSSFSNHIAPAGKILVERERKPLLTKTTLSNADIVLYQLGELLKIKNSRSKHWFPISYIYHEQIQPIWQKLESMAYCKKILPLFGVKSIDDLKFLINEYQQDETVMYPTACDHAPFITNSINVDDIGSLN